MNIINLTPHELAVISKDGEKVTIPVLKHEGRYVIARSQEEKTTTSLAGFALTHVKMLGTAIGLFDSNNDSDPECWVEGNLNGLTELGLVRPGDIIVVSLVWASDLKAQAEASALGLHLVAPGPAIREEGKVVGAIGFSAAPTQQPAAITPVDLRAAWEDGHENGTHGGYASTTTSVRHRERVRQLMANADGDAAPGQRLRVPPPSKPYVVRLLKDVQTGDGDRDWIDKGSFGFAVGEDAQFIWVIGTQGAYFPVSAENVSRVDYDSARQFLAESGRDIDVLKFIDALKLAVVQDAQSPIFEVESLRDLVWQVYHNYIRT